MRIYAAEESRDMTSRRTPCLPENHAAAMQTDGPPTTMSKTRDGFEGWRPDYLRPRYPDLEPALLRAIDATDSIGESGRITKELLAPIVEAGCRSRAPLWENASDLLSHLTGRFPEACEALVSMAHDRQWQVRFNAI